MNFFRYFFSEKKLYPACGIFTAGHFAFLLSLFTLILLGIYFSRNATEKGIRKQTLVIAIVIDVMESIKVAYYLSWGYTNPGYWVPLSFCALFLYATWFSLSKHKLISDIGKIWIAFGGLFGGMCFLFYPSTSLLGFQFFHYISFQSMIYHALMVYLGILYLSHGIVKPDLKSFKVYSLSLLCIFSLVFFIDYTFNLSFMFLRDPYALPQFVKSIAAWCTPVYSLLVIAAHIFAPFLIISLLYDGISKITEAHEMHHAVSDKVRE